MFSMAVFLLGNMINKLEKQINLETWLIAWKHRNYLDNVEASLLTWQHHYLVGNINIMLETVFWFLNNSLVFKSIVKIRSWPKMFPNSNWCFQVNIEVSNCIKMFPTKFAFPTNKSCFQVNFVSKSILR